VGLRNESRAEFGTLRSESRAEFAALRSESRADFAALRSESRAEFAALRADLSASQRQIAQIGWAMATAVVGLMIALLIAAL
jgi:hypothetical protein